MMQIEKDESSKKDSGVARAATKNEGNNNTATFTITIRRADDPLDQTNVAILAAITAIVIVCSLTWLPRRRKALRDFSPLARLSSSD